MPPTAYSVADSVNVLSEETQNFAFLGMSVNSIFGEN